MEIVYIGTLGLSYDIKCVFDALAIMKSKGYGNVHTVLIGDGPLKSDFLAYAADRQLDCEFTGQLPYDQMIRRMAACEIAVNPIAKGSAGSLINKVMDYAAAGLPVVNTQECQEYRHLVEAYGCGINCECGNAAQMADALVNLMKDHEKRRKMAAAARKLAEDCFDRKSTYGKIVDLVRAL
jgi:glycosyltransferase involved in cell wall biosynthesis